MRLCALLLSRVNGRAHGLDAIDTRLHLGDILGRGSPFESHLLTGREDPQRRFQKGLPR